VPVFSELLEHKRQREALHLAASLFGLILAVGGGITVLFILVAGVLMPVFTGPEFTPALDDLTVGLSRVLFPIVVLLGINGLVVGILNAHDHFTIPALTPLVWNLVIIAGMVVLTPLFEGPDQLYAYAIGVVAGTVVQLAMCIPPLRAVGFPLRISFDFRDPRIPRVLKLMLPVSIGLGLINVSVVLNSTIGFRVSDEAPRAIDAPQPQRAGLGGAHRLHPRRREGLTHEVRVPHVAPEDDAPVVGNGKHAAGHEGRARALEMAQLPFQPVQVERGDEHPPLLPRLVSQAHVEGQHAAGIAVRAGVVPGREGEGALRARHPLPVPLLLQRGVGGAGHPVRAGEGDEGEARRVLAQVRQQVPQRERRVRVAGVEGG